MVEEKKESPDQTPPAETAPDVKDILIATLLKAYSPHETDGQLELKSTFDIVEEMSTIADIDNWIIHTAMIAAGFTVQIAGDCYLWKMYRIN